MTTISTGPSASQDLDDKEWESVENPEQAASVADIASETDAVDIDAETAAAAAAEESEATTKVSSTELAEEGVKIEAANPADEEGVEVEKPIESGGNSTKGGLEGSRLAKDW